MCSWHVQQQRTDLGGIGSVAIVPRVEQDDTIINRLRGKWHCPLGRLFLAFFHDRIVQDKLSLFRHKFLSSLGHQCCLRLLGSHFFPNDAEGLGIAVFDVRLPSLPRQTVSAMVIRQFPVAR